MSLFEYYGELTEVFCELDHRDKVVMKDLEDIATYRKSIERQWVHIFLAGLDGDFEQVRGEILCKDLLPDLEECYALIRQEAVRHASMKAKSDNPDTLAMTHHTKSRCFEIVGCPDWWDHNRDQRKKDSKKTSTAVVAEIKIEANVAEKASALVAAIDYGDRSHPLNLPHKKLFPQPMDESGQPELVNQKAGELDMSGTTLEPSSNDHPETKEVIEEGRDSTIEPLPPFEQFGSEDVFTEIPNQSSSVEGVLKLEPDPFMKRLPHRHNRGIPKPTYEPELSTKVKYPMSNYEALADRRWKAAMNEEMKSLQKNETWELVECPSGKKLVGCRWIYAVKYKADAKINTIRVLLSLTANLDWPLQQFDVKNAFLHGELSEEVYMDLPPGCMVSEKQCQKVCKLKKSLYGLKQSPRAWFRRFTKSMRAFGYHQSNSDHTLFLKKQHGKITTLVVYVDDMVVTGNDPEERKALQNDLSREFEMKDLGLLKYFLGETGMLGCQPVDTPIEESLKLCVEPNQVSTDKEKYQRLVGRLMYLTHTRPDLAYALSVVSQYMHNLREQHMNAVMRILRYLKNAPGKGILFTKNVDHQSIEVYTDADWASVEDYRRSTSGYFTFVDGFLSRQPIRLFCDNKVACDIAHNPIQHDRTKHVEVDIFFIKEKLDDKIVELPKIRLEDQLADILTKVAVSS
ncbi:Retrovirus-related Pol polyprotein from transposon RE1 [Vitis vinifera]|uniref:Retrovirus-related Pol polyprotein from transposon RE1 n=1 Tax=Vitis vinifera TaxID=29760 RepID=A0A438GUY1_VITVI|nr:Retrovirus-related Pol polyprotein from transposon RE1 [Vitis vinifera]